VLDVRARGHRRAISAATLAVLTVAMWGAAANGGAGASPDTAPSTSFTTTTVIAPDTVPDGGDVLPDPDDLELQTPNTFTTDAVVSEPLIAFPPECPAPRPAVAVFEAEVVAGGVILDRAQFRVIQVRAGSMAGWFDSRRRVNVFYGSDARFLNEGERYLVGVGTDQEGTGLVSRVRPPAPMFGGDAVIGLNESEVRCPEADEQILTLTVAGGAVDSGVLSGLGDRKNSLLRAVVAPAAIAFVILVGLVSAKLLLFSFVNSLRASESGPPVERTRRHRPRPGPDQT
jgi:hypothetical protein